MRTALFSLDNRILGVHSICMPYDPEKRKEKALKQTRGNHGQFASRDTDGEEQRRNRMPSFSDIFASERVADPTDETLINVRINNPFHRIIKLLKDIKSHQSTTVAFRFSIPLIALPIFFLGAFQLGRFQSSCATVTTSKIGILQTITVSLPPPPGPLDSLKRLIPGIPSLTKPSELESQQQTLLLSANDEITHLVHPDSLSLRSFEGQPVLITGTYSECTKTMTVDTRENVRVY